MKTEEIRSRLRGVIAFPVTPFNADLSLDTAGLHKNLRELLKYPISAVVAAGGTGELYSLTPAEQLEVVKTVVEEVNGKTPVLAGVGFNTEIAIALAKQSESAGANAILALPPYYPNADETGLLEYYAGIGSATPLPLFVYSRYCVNPCPDWV